jgi:hypothetical protein
MSMENRISDPRVPRAACLNMRLKLRAVCTQFDRSTPSRSKMGARCSGIAPRSSRRSSRPVQSNRHVAERACRRRRRGRAEAACLGRLGCLVFSPAPDDSFVGQGASPLSHWSACDRVPELRVDEPREMGDVVHRHGNCVARPGRQLGVRRRDAIFVQRVRARPRRLVSKPSAPESRNTSLIPGSACAVTVVPRQSP